MRSKLNMTSADPAAQILEEDLEEWRKLLSGPTQVQLVWDDADEPATDINAARLRAKYYGAKYIVTRPSLEYALHRMKQRPDLLNDMVQHSSPATTTGSMPSSTPGSSDFVRQGWSDERQDKQDRDIIEGCKRCIAAAKQSTVAFDRIRDHGRLVVTNIFGTAQAYVVTPHWFTWETDTVQSIWQHSSAHCCTPILAAASDYPVGVQFSLQANHTVYGRA